MATPLKSLILSSPKVYSSVSPQIIRQLRNSVAGCTPRASPHVSRRLEFQNTTKSGLLQAANSEIKIKVSDFDVNLKAEHKDLLINTPNKCDLLKNGVGKQNFLNVLGKGSFGTVIRGVYKGSTVAIKIIANKNTTYTNETNAVKLNHENIVRTINVFTNREENYSLVIMEYCPNVEQLQTFLETDAVISNKEKYKYGRDVCKALQYCHENGILHLDVKPKNVLLFRNICKLCDFGNSVRIADIGDKYQHHGTISYTDPAILLGGKPTTKSDVYSLAILLWQLEYRKNPYENIDNNETIIYKVIKCNLRPKIDEENEFSKLICKCWDAKPDNRPQVLEVLEKLQNPDNLV